MYITIEFKDELTIDIFYSKQNIENFSNFENWNKLCFCKYKLRKTINWKNVLREIVFL